MDEADGQDLEARLAFLERHRAGLRRMIAARLDRRVASRVDPSDVVQDTLADAAGRVDVRLPEHTSPFFGWLRHLAGDRVIDAHRRHLVSQRRSVTRETRICDGSDRSNDRHLPGRLVADDTTPSDRLVRQEQLAEVRAALDSLSSRDREVLAMRFFEERETSEIADALGISEGAVRVRLLRGLKRLRGRIEDLS
ncbi:sigma-70 family RNA polymerase sigma factor [Aquisphaera insulae]|uniref:sigma-70 family RNA polymerase sigma factor n=1 Tax=Aquisphaera insulae TaxID=2712864 RepID=UPI0013EA1316|nr:sigma-70 family RNA polymerase sigma factor [Aquisphaera insulae]